MGVPKVLPLFSSGMQRGIEGKDENETDRPFSTVLRYLHISFLEYLTRRRRFGRLHAIGIGQLAEFDSYIVRGGVGAIVERDLVNHLKILCWPESRTQDNSGP